MFKTKSNKKKIAESGTSLIDFYNEAINRLDVEPIYDHSTLHSKTSGDKLRGDCPFNDSPILGLASWSVPLTSCSGVQPLTLVIVPYITYFSTGKLCSRRELINTDIQDTER